jgi:RHS repeat-associated protein
VPPGASYTFGFNVTAPTPAGTYNFQWGMVHDGVNAFGARTPNVAVAVNGVNDAQLMNQSVPSSMVPGGHYRVFFDLKNTGNTTWAPGSYYLASMNAADNSTWGTNRVDLAAPVNPGDNVIVDFDVTAPATAGSYNFQWQMTQRGTRFGALTTNVPVSVSAGDNAAFVSQSVPSPMAPGQSYAVSVTMQNTGGTSWSPGTYYLASMNAADNTTWGLNRVNLTDAVAAGANVTLSFNVTAPATAGSYNFQWQMTQGGTRFGALSPNIAVNVTTSTAGAQLYFIQTDHLDTPRLIADQAGNTVWRNDNTEPFGDSVPNGDPGGTGNTFEMPLSFVGQYRDRETGISYNYFRDYDPRLGRYVESDPLGLRAGLNTYLYVDANALSRKDPQGLYEVNPHDYFNGGGGGGGGGSSGFAGGYLPNYIVPGQTPSGTITSSDAVAAGVILAGSAFAGAAAAEISTFAIDNWILFNKIRTIASMCIRMMKPLDPNNPELPPPPPVSVPPAVRPTPSSSPPQPRPMKP